ncbi:nitrate- and nitrite sensing domain-containing protein [Streptomyces sp. NPDC020917]|uniref:sensor histidine kinase n=1 Tax=Streptomyces sp. NPDC020917 TaxID=3365102 RepID=UPI0037A29976
MRNWRVATRLNAILLIPVLVALVFGGFRVKSSVDTWHQADDAVRTANLVRAAATYSNALEDERDVTVVPLIAGKRTDSTVSAAYAATDAAARAFDQAAQHIPDEADLKRRMANFRSVEPQLASLRKAAFTRQLSGVQTEEWYVKIQHPLMELANELGFGTSNGAAYGRTLYAASLAKAAESLTRSIGMHILVGTPASAQELALQKTALGSYQYLQGIAVEEYEGGGTAADQARLKAAQDQAEKKGQDAITQAQSQAAAAHAPFVVPPDLTKMVNDIANPVMTTKELRAEGVTPESYMAASTLSFDAYRSVEVALADQAASDAARIASNAKRDALVNSAIVVVALILAFIVAGMMARAMSRSMRRLRAAAFDIAETRLPGLVDQLSRTDPGRVDTQVAPIPINTQDEIGEVARAFDQVHREAVRLAAEQALLRGNVNAIFTNLSQRNQGLIQRQLELITDLENNEADPDQLENLFRMDHLATRMRRNGENLLVLAGEEPGRQWNQPIPLVDVLRAAASEVEAYDRIELVGIPETDIHGSAVTDLVHLLAELLENATTFSSPQTKVRVTATRLPDGRVMVEIHDRGIGLTAEDFADINRKLADPPTVDVEIAKRMGLFVVGRLSQRHGIRVQLRPSGEQAGTTSLVMLPEPITHGGGGEELLGDDQDFTVSRIVPEHPDEQQGYGGLDHRSAAELGFDDSRYEQNGALPGGGPSLDPVGRSLLREERRAQLEAAAADRREEPGLPGQEQQDAAAGYGQDGYPAGYGAQPGYEQQNGYPGEYAAPQGYEQQGGYAPQENYAASGYPAGTQEQNGFFEQPYESGQSYPNNGYPVADYEPAGHQAEFSGYQPAHDDWPVTDAQVTESAPPLPQQPEESVVSPSLTDAGLPRRDRRQTTSPQPQPAQESPEPQPQPTDQSPDEPLDAARDDDDWRSTNDEHWQRAEQVREPKAGGVTPSGLPRRVPQANLVPGTATQTPQGGPQVSRAPEDVRGRLSNLRRGVQQGRTAGTDTNGQATDSRFGGPQNQER